MSHEFRIAVFPGDGIGREVMAPCLTLLEAVTSQAPEFRLRFESHEAGAELYLKTGVALPEEALRRRRVSRRHPSRCDGTPGRPLSQRHRGRAADRPARSFPALCRPPADSRASRRAHPARRPARARDRLRDRPRVHRRAVRGAHREPSRRRRGRPRHDAHHAARLASGCSRRRSRSRAAARRPDRAARVTCVDKANVLPSMAFFRRLFLECAARHPDVDADCLYVDAAALRLVRSPWEFDVLVTENMFGDILSDLGAGLMGGMGMAPSADVGDAPRGVSAVPRHRAGHRRPRAGQSDRDVPVGGDDARLARRSSLGPGVPERRARLDAAFERAFAGGTLVPVEHGGAQGRRRLRSVCSARLEVEARLTELSGPRAELLNSGSRLPRGDELDAHRRPDVDFRPGGRQPSRLLIDAEDDHRIRPLIAARADTRPSDRCRTRAASSPASAAFRRTSAALTSSRC